MYSSSALLEIHTRTHEALDGLLDHCATLDAARLAQELDGFGYPTVRLQLHHVFGAERYWIGVLQGEMLVDEDPADHSSVDALRAFQRRVGVVTREYLASQSDEALSTPCKVDTWSRKQVDVVPAHVVLRTQMHAFQHKGQVTAMCRLLDRPVPDGLDFRVT